MNGAPLGDLVEAADAGALVTAIDAICGRSDWEVLTELRHRLAAAVERGKPLWPLITYAEYRTALEAPAAHAAAVLRPGAARFALGPLTEVAASTHPFDELARQLDDPAVAGAVAAERVLRGEDLRGHPNAHPEVLELPLVLLRFEPAYALATYGPDSVEVPDPGATPVPMDPVAPARAAALPRTEAARALEGLVEVWTTQSDGRARAVVVRGGPPEALGQFGLAAGRVGRLRPAEALARMAWAAASGGAHGVRRGAALGRFDAWWAATTLAGLAWPPDPQSFEEAIDRLEWGVFDDGFPGTGWSLRLVVTNPAEGWTAALDAADEA